MAIDLELDAEMLLGLRAFTDGSPSAVSPWKGVDAPVSDAVRARLANAGALDATGARRELRPTLAAIATATASTSLCLVGTGVLVVYVVWVSSDHDPVGMSAIAKKGVFRLEDPAPTDRVVELIAALVGRGPLRGMDLALDLSIEDSVALAAIVDAQRHAILAGLGAGHAGADGPVDLGVARRVLDEPPSSGLLSAIRRVCGPAAHASASGLTESIASLTRQGLVEGDSSAVRLAGPCAELAQRFAAITACVELANAYDSGADGVARLALACLQAGVSDLMTVEWVKTGIHLETVSADTVVGYIDRLLHQPDLARTAVQSQPHEVRLVSTVAGSTDKLASSRSTVPIRKTPTDKPPWRPTHLVPAGGMDAWATPDPTGIPVARIDPRAELQLLERSYRWAHIVCSNGWSAWVDARAIEQLPADAAVSGQSESFTEPGTQKMSSTPTVVTRLPRNPTGSTAVWRPTHTVPAGGIAARPRPDAAEPPIAKIDAGTEFEVLERRGDWAHMRCRNGWSAWVEGNAIQARRNEDPHKSR